MVMALLLIDAMFRLVNNSFMKMDAKTTSVAARWQYASAMMSRAASIEAQYSDILTHYPQLFEDAQDSVRAMGELDALAKGAGVQVEMIRPLTPSKDRNNLDYEMNLRGQWSQLMAFLKNAEGRKGLFRFSSFEVHRQDITGDLLVSAVATRLVLSK